MSRLWDSEPVPVDDAPADSGGDDGKGGDCKDGAGKDLRRRLSLDDPTKPPDSKSAAEEEDAHVLEIDWEDKSVRYKSWRDACSQSQVLRFADFPLEGPVTSVDLAMHMQRLGGDPANWMLQFFS